MDASTPEPVVCIAFGMSQPIGTDAFLKLLGLGLATAVILDATVVRGVLVLACVGLAGRANFGHLEGVVSHRGAWFDAAMAVAAEGVGLPVPLPAARRTPVR